ncbi:uncharacterized protein V1516DRAFT_676913 [Lipomyces oligophaga]|uniref:uncharacterized protein n=1 Tax=Lipomyces oligophaga TaxID=45792 RepID=UPI0034CD636B
MVLQNKSVLYEKFPVGVPGPESLVVKSAEIEPEAPEGGMFVQVLVLSLDPYLRGRMRDPSLKSYSSAFEFGKPISNFGVAKVLKSDTLAFAEGDLVVSPTTESTIYQAVEKQFVGFYRKIENPHNFPLSYFVGVLGMPGMTGYHGLLEVGGPLKKNETLLISAASGAVGQIVGQLAKRAGMRVVGYVGSDDKMKYLLEELKFDDAWNYKVEKDPYEAIANHIPEGIDLYFDNVGGELLDAALVHMKDFGRIVACGMISQYNNKPGEGYRFKNLNLIVGKRLRMEGFIILDTMQSDPTFIGRFEKDVSDGLLDKSIVYREYEVDGLDNLLDGFLELLSGKNFGKVFVKVSDY